MRVLVLVGLLSLSLCASASAATRYAAPGGSGADPCTDPSKPCSIYTAADVTAPGTTVTAGDLVMLAPGAYTDTGGDLGPTARVQPAPNVRIQSEPGKARPLIRLELGEGGGAFFIGGGASVADVAIENLGSGIFPQNNPAITIDTGGVAERIIARSTLAPAITCTMLSGGILRESVCLNEAPSGTALGASLLTSAGTRAVTVRDVTALATGSGSFGASFNYFGSEASPTIFNVSLKGVIARGQLKDVRAAGLRNGPTGVGATTSIILDHSDYASTDTLVSGGGSASVTPAGSGTNITAAPLFGADGYHQLPTSPTVDKGVVDVSSGTVDLDGQLRTIGSAPDIGADELAHTTALSIACSPETLVASGEGSGTGKCPAIVTDTSPGATAPTGSVKFSSDGGIIVNFCTLVSISTVASSCDGSWSSFASGLGVHQLTAKYEGDSSHDGSEGTATINLVAPQPSGGGTGGAGAGGGVGSSGAGGGSSGSNQTPVAVAPATALGKHPPKRTPQRLAKFTFASDQPGAGFECKLDKRQFKPCSSPFKRKVALGGHSFSVRAVAASGLADTTPAIYRWTRPD